MPVAYNNEFPINYQVEGDHSNPAVIMLHGFLNDLNIWYDTSFVKSLKSNYYLILIDLRGYGKSYKPHDPDSYYLTHRVNDVVAVMDKEKLKQANIMGYSMGGRIAFGFAKYAYNRIKTLIIGGMSPFGNMPIDLDKRIKMLENGMELTVRDYETHHGKLPEKLRNRILNNDHQALIADTIDTKQWKGIKHILHKIKIPVLYYVGERDYFQSEAEEAAKLMPNCRFITLKNADHQRAYIRKSLIINHLLQFLNENN